MDGRGGEAFVDDGIEILSELQCWELLSGATIGRVGVCVGAMPAIFPVNFVLEDQSIVFRTGEGTKLTAATNHAVVAFQCDHVDEAEHGGWSVLGAGIAEAVKDRDEIERLRNLPLWPWAGGHREIYARVELDFISGRRIIHF